MELATLGAARIKGLVDDAERSADATPRRRTMPGRTYWPALATTAMLALCRAGVCQPIGPESDKATSESLFNAQVDSRRADAPASPPVPTPSESAEARNSLEDVVREIMGRCDLTQSLFNFHQLSPGDYRSGFPSKEGFARLQAMGIKTILSLVRPKETPSPLYGGKPLGGTERELIESLGMSYVDLPMPSMDWPSYEQLDQALAVLTDPARQPVLVHCMCGDDRTGIVSATYRVVVQSWSPEQAAQEAKTNHWHFPLFGDLTGFLTKYADYRSGLGGTTSFDAGKQEE